jgi:hypothetical protein
MRRCLSVVEEGPKRIQRKRTKGWRMPENTVYVGRPTLWGNPYNTGDKKIDVACYRQELMWFLKGDGRNTKHGRDLRSGLKRLAGKNLACYCGLDEPCHADVLLELANNPELWDGGCDDDSSG